MFPLYLAQPFAGTPQPVVAGGRPLVTVATANQGFDYWRGKRPLVSPATSAQFAHWLGKRPLVALPPTTSPASAADYLGNWFGGRPLISPANSVQFDKWFPGPVTYLGNPTNVQAVRAFDFVQTIGANLKLANQASPFTQPVASMVALGGKFIREAAPISSAQYGAAYITAVNNLYTNNGVRASLIVDPREGWTDCSIGGATDIVATLVAAGINPAGIMLEGPNELDLNTSVAYRGHTGIEGAMVLMNDLMTNTRAAGAPWATMPLIAPSIAQPGLGSTKFNTAAGVLGYNLGAVCTHFNMHFYQGGDVPLHNFLSEWVTDMNLITGINSATTPIYITEGGYNTNGVTGEALQPGVSRLAHAKYLLRLYVDFYGLFTKDPSQLTVSGFSVYDLYPPDGPVDATIPWTPTSGLGSWSIVDQSAVALPAYTAVQNLCTIVGDPTGGSYSPGVLKYGITPNSPTLVQLLLQRSDGTFFLILSQEGESVSSFDTTAQVDLTPPAITELVTFATIPRAITQYTPLTGASGIPLTPTKTLSITIADHPLIFAITP